MPFEDTIKKARRRPLFTPTETTREVMLGRDAIERLLPHRDPFLFVDRISAVDLAQETVRAHRRIDPDDTVFSGHFPGQPVYPGALQVEMMGQTGLCLHQLLELGRLDVRPEDAPRPLRLLRLHHALFQAEVRPGDDLVLYSKRIHHDSYTVVCAAQVLKGDRICAMSIMEVYLVGDDD